MIRKHHDKECLLVKVTVNNPCIQAGIKSWESREDKGNNAMRILQDMSRYIPQNVLAQEEDPTFGKDVQHIPDMDAKDVFVNLRCKTYHYKQKVLARDTIQEHNN